MSLDLLLFVFGVDVHYDCDVLARIGKEGDEIEPGLMDALLSAIFYHANMPLPHPK